MWKKSQGPWTLAVALTFLIILLHAKEQPEDNSSRRGQGLESSSSFFFRSRRNSSSSLRGETLRSKREDGWDDFGDDFDDDIFGEVGSNDLQLTTTSASVSPVEVRTTSTELPTSLGAGEHLRTVRETDDEDLDGVGSGEEGSGSRETPDPTPVTPVPPDLDAHKRFYRITLTINKSWSPALTSATSNAFKVYEDELSDAVTRSSAFDIASVKVIQFTDIKDPGWIQVRFDVGVEDVPKSEIEAEFQTFLNVGAVGNIRLKRDNFSIQDAGSPLETVCFDNELKCRNGRCIAVALRCNAVNDCGDDDSTDEDNCPVTTPDTPTPLETTSTSTPFPPMEDCRADDQVRCFDGRAIICADQVCDGHINCPGGEDEDSRMNCTMIDPSCPPSSFQCDFGKCLPDAVKCNGIQDCDDGSDENLNECQWTSSTPGGVAPTICRPDEFRCRSTLRCIPVAALCNGVNDCGSNDKSDEDFECPCSNDQFKCGTGICIDRVNVCDGLVQCSDRSDEENCPQNKCSAEEFVCHSDSSCVPLSAKCNQRVDCQDGSDEQNCVTPTCRSNEYRCEVGGQCVGIGKRCDRVDDCPGGDDERGCGFTPEPEKCDSRYHFQCKDGSCIDKVLKCDAFPDCPDRSDESSETCPGTGLKCRPYEFECFDRSSCISASLRCDGITDCRDRSDEHPDLCRGSRLCANWEYKCEDGRCIEKELLCNGKFDCYSGSDERNCTTCRPGEFRCLSGGCIAWSQRCDNIPDCRDFSDEDPAICHGPCTDDLVLCGDGVTCVKDARECDDPGVTSSAVDVGTIKPTPPPVQCSFGQFKCRDGSCIAQLERCNGKVDCPDSSDEEQCSACLDSFRCSNGQCIDNRYKCDDTPQCPNGDDEQNCGSTCSREQFTCANGQCIPVLYKCDSVPDCADNSDETVDTCPDVMTCGADEFKCIAGGCIPREKVCDRRFDCADGSDEVLASCPPACREDEFRCVKDASCVPMSAKCNGRRDCSDDSDEQNCPVQPQPSKCGFGEFACRSGNQCVPSSAICNSIYDCNDYSDESNCGSPPEGLHLKTYPSDQSIKQGNEVVFQCRDEGQLRASVRWVRGNGLPLPTGSRDFNGRLEMPNIALDHSGTYICEAVGYPESTPGAKVAVYLRVDPSAGKPLLSRYDFGMTNDTEWHVPQRSTSIDEAPPTRPPTACALHEATCSNGDCIAKNMICDGDQDCADGSDEMRCRLDGCEPNEFQCYNKKCVLKTWRCDGDDDCGDSSDEQNCEPPPPGSPCRYNEFQCSTGNHCIMKSFQCDKEIDCPDRSDEQGCSPPTIITPPPSLVTLDVGDVFNISCRVHGVPTPEVIWRLNWGHIPDKCLTSCENGVGVLTCHDIQYAEQGAYSCEAINSLGSTFAIPDCTLVVRDSGLPTCGPGRFNEQARSDAECLPCFCFGQTTQCSSLKMYTAELPPPEANYHLLGVSQDLLAGRVPIQPRGPPGTSAQVTSIRRDFRGADVIPFFALPSTYTGNQLRSYGGILRYRLKYEGTASVISGPDVVISGNGVMLLHVGGQSWATGQEHEVSVKYWTGEWFKGVKTGRPGTPVQGVEPATREELMMVLANMDNLLIRAQYDQGSALDVTVSHIRMTTASGTNAGLGQAAFVEECRCPPGYLGLSCESCAPGYERILQGPWLGRCQPVRERCPEGTYDEGGQCRPCPCPGAGRKFGRSCYRDTDNAVTCACNEGHVGRNCAECASGYAPNPSYPYECRPIGVRCDVAGSLSPTPDPFTQRCNCKENAIGTLCNQCKAGTFHLNTDNQFGCINCFCMGIVTQCSSSNWFRTQERTSFYQGPQNFALIDSSQQSSPIRDLTVEPSSRELAYRGFTGGGPGVIYYWQLPEQYLGDKVTSYGGYLNYTVRYVPPPGGQTSPNTGPDVELNGNDIRLLYYRRGPTIPPNRAETVSVPLLEQFWQRQDGRFANREHLLMALASLESLLIKATYTTYSRESYLSEVSLDYSIQRNTGQDRAWAVEDCQCPEGYLGLSCQECSSGYTRSLKGLYLGLCERCSCNGHSDECDPKLGICKNCRGFTTGDFCDECEVGYTGNPKFGDCAPESLTRCHCDSRGSIRPDCPFGPNQCVCKTNVEGPTCTNCRRTTFNLQASNPHGCAQCYCSGVSTDCSSAHLYRLPIRMDIQGEPHGFTLTDSYRTATVREITVDTRAGELVYSFLANSPRPERLFWSLPPKFTGNRITSYGGQLRASRRYYVRPGTISNPTEDIDVILTGRNGVSLFYAGTRPTAQTAELDVTLHETGGWRHSDGSAKPANREDLLSVLADIEAILIRATFTENMESTHLKDVSLDDAVRQATQYGVVSDVEECRCPFGYVGLSCESCSAMFYRDPNDRSRTPRGSCVRCPCSENAEGCVYEGGRPVCTCRPGFSGVDCSTRVDVVVELSPVQINTYADGRLEDFRCSYKSRLPLRIQFLTTPPWNDLLPQPLTVGVALPIEPTWTRSLTVKIPITPRLRRVTCRITNDEDEVVAEVSASVNSTRGRGGPDPAPPTAPSQGSGKPPGSPEIEVRIADPVYQTVQPGGSAMFRCSARSQTGSQLRLAWVKEVGSIPIGRARDDGQGMLVISDVRPEDAGTFVCQATDGYSTASERATLAVGGGGGSQPNPPESRPEVTITPPYLQLKVGDPAELKCTATGFPPPTLTWTGGRSGQLPAHARSQNGILSFAAIRKRDEAEYHCTAENRQGIGSLRTIIYVQGQDEEESEVAPGERSPELTVSVAPTESEARPGETVRIHCETSDRSARIEWTRRSGNLPQSSTQSNDGQLTIFSVTEDDSGSYTCTATSANGESATEDARLQVSYAGATPTARIEPERQTVTQGRDIELRCIASGSPLPAITWSKAGGSLATTVNVTNELLRIPNAQVSDRGVYICNAENNVGKGMASGIVEVERREPPQLEIYPSSRQVALKDSSALFQCRLAAGIPTPRVSWSRADGLPMPTNTETIQGGVLRFNRLTGDEKGSYICTGENVAGTTTAAAVLEVQVPPTVTLTPPSPHRVRTGERVRLECRAEGDPLPTVTWSRIRNGQIDGLALPLAQDVFRTPQNAVYEISRVSKGDEGSYSCSARNDAGVEEARLQLLVEDAGAPSRASPGQPSHASSGHQPQVTPRPEPEPVGGREQVYYFPVGSQAELPCSQDIRGGGFEQLYLDWERSDNGLMPSNYAAIDGKLIIESVRPEDAGRYSCIGRNTQGDIVFASDAILEVSGSSPPLIELRPARQIVRRGDIVFIHCAATGQQPISINWSRVDRSPFYKTVTVNGPDLMFRPIEVIDAGRYACTATNAGGTSEAVAEVIVNTPSGSQPGSNGPVLSRTPRPARTRSQTGIAGQRVELQCRLQGPGIVWTKGDNEPLPRNAIALGPSLTLMSLSPSDAGRYSCESIEGYDEIELSVEARHDHEGTDDQWACQRGDQLIPLSQLCDGEVDCDDGSDERQCDNPGSSRRSRHLLERQQRNAGVLAAEPVTVRITATKDEVELGNDVEIRCDVAGDSNPFIRWHKVGGALGSNVKVTENVLRVTSAVPENGGVYRCMATTRSGIYEDNYTLTIHANPDVPMNSVDPESPDTRNIIPFGSTVKMNCSTDLDHPINYIWSKEGGLVPDRSTMEGRTLIIPDLVPEDSGRYVCTASTATKSVDIPIILTVTEVVPHFTQTPTSYMTLPTLEDSYNTMDITISFKPEERNGLILYNGQRKDGTGDFFSFGLAGGVPQFKLDVGSGTMTIKGDRALEMGKWTTVTLSRDKEVASMTVKSWGGRESGPFNGTLRGNYDVLNLIDPMYVGGVPYSYFGQSMFVRSVGYGKGFVGCVSELMISGKKQLLFKDLQTSQGVTTCDTCSGVTCLNGGICQEGLTSRGYMCICDPGYSGPDCQTEVEACRPGICGTGKCLNGPEGFECQCPLGKGGEGCQQDLSITEPSFNGNAFLSYPTPKALKRLKMSVRFKPESEDDGVVIYGAQNNNGDGDFASVSLRDKHVEFQYNAGSGAAVIRSKRSVTMHEWTEVTVERNDQEGALTFKGEEVKGRSPGVARGLNLNTQLYLGGYDRSRIQVNSQVGVSQGFKGCVSKLEVEGMTLELMRSAIDSANVEQCEALPCANNPCQNRGLCSSNSSSTYYCDCVEPYEGVNCEIERIDSCRSQPCVNGGSCYNLPVSYKCSCPKGYHGRNCETVLEFEESLAFRGEGYLELSSSLCPHADSETEEVLQFELSTTAKHGLLFFQGQGLSDTVEVEDFWSVGLVDGKVVFRWNLGDGEGHAVSEKTIDDGNRHNITIRRTGTDGTVEVDGEFDSGSSYGNEEDLDTSGNIFLGGAPDVGDMTKGHFHDGFIGCVHSVRIQNSLPLKLNEVAISAVNTGPCNSTFHKPDGDGRIISTKREEYIEVEGNKTIKRTRLTMNVTEYSYSDEYTDYSEPSSAERRRHSS